MVLKILWSFAQFKFANTSSPNQVLPMQVRQPYQFAQKGIYIGEYNISP